MTQPTQQALQHTRAGDIAVNGLVGGILAGLGMAAFLTAAGVLSGLPPSAMLGRFDPGQGGNWATGLAAHLAVSGIYGVVFAMLFAGLLRLWPALRSWAWLAGLLYGLFLLVVVRRLIFGALPSEMLRITGVQLFLSHAIYGLLLGLELRRMGP